MPAGEVLHLWAFGLIVAEGGLGGISETTPMRENWKQYNKSCYILKMNGLELKTARIASSWTQNDAARKLGVTQAYLSMIERGTRPLSKELVSRAIDVFDVPPTALPLGEYKPKSRDEFSFKLALGALGYPGFAYLGRSETPQAAVPNPAELLLDALDCEDLDARVVEALPWLPLAYPGFNWDWLVKNAKLRDRQNRLAYIVNLARQIAERKGNLAAARILAKWIHELERSRLASEDALCEEGMTQAERKWLRTHRPPEAEHWNLLTDLKVEHLDHAFA